MWGEVAVSSGCRRRSRGRRGSPAWPDGKSDIREGAFRVALRLPSLLHHRHRPVIGAEGRGRQPRAIGEAVVGQVFPCVTNGHGLHDLGAADDDGLADDLGFGGLPLLIGSGNLEAGERAAGDGFEAAIGVMEGNGDRMAVDGGASRQRAADGGDVFAIDGAERLFRGLLLFLWRHVAKLHLVEHVFPDVRRLVDVGGFEIEIAFVLFGRVAVEAVGLEDGACLDGISG